MTSFRIRSELTELRAESEKMNTQPALEEYFRISLKGKAVWKSFFSWEYYFAFENWQQQK